MPNQRFQIGADPEFIILRNGQFQHAGNTLGARTEEQIGADGRSDTGELRPSPGNNVAVTQNLDQLIRELHNRIGEECQAHAGSGLGAPCGGHIHFSREIQPTKALLNKLDNYIAKPLNTISDTSERHHYGRYGDRRPQPHGWEYRAPLSWLAHPTLTKGALTIAQVLARAQLDGNLARIRNRNGLLRFANKFEQRAIRKFYEFIEQHQGQQIERIDIIAAWRKRKWGRPSTNHQHQVTYSSRDEMLEDMPQLKCRIPLEIVGIGNYRTIAKEVYAPEIAGYMLPNRLFWTPITFTDDWNWRGGTSAIRIGLSWELRRDHERAKKVVKAIVAWLNRPRDSNHEQYISNYLRNFGRFFR